MMQISDPKQAICIAATFTIEPIKDALNSWMQELNFPFRIDFAPYNQVFQQLLDPASLISQNQNGINIVLVRLEDWQRFEKAEINLQEKIRQNTTGLIQALQSAAMHLSSPFLVCTCPASPVLLADEQNAAFFQDMEMHLKTGLESLHDVYLVTSAEFNKVLPSQGIL